MKKFKERRRCKRYKILNCTPHVMTSYPERVLSSRLLDVSDNGLAFSYNGWVELQIKDLKIDFFDLHRRLFLWKIPAQVINDIILLKENKKNLRRCSIEFSFGDNDQMANWRCYIEHVATKIN